MSTHTIDVLRVHPVSAFDTVHTPLYSALPKPPMKTILLFENATFVVTVSVSPLLARLYAPAVAIFDVDTAHVVHANVIVVAVDAVEDTAHWPLYPPSPDRVKSVPVGSAVAPSACPQPVAHVTVNEPDADTTAVVV